MWSAYEFFSEASLGFSSCQLGGGLRKNE